MLLLKGAKILHFGIPVSRETNYGRLMTNCESKYRSLSREKVAV